MSIWVLALGASISYLLLKQGIGVSLDDVERQALVAERGEGRVDPMTTEGVTFADIKRQWRSTDATETPARAFHERLSPGQLANLHAAEDQIAARVHMFDSDPSVPTIQGEYLPMRSS